MEEQQEIVCKKEEQLIIMLVEIEGWMPDFITNQMTEGWEGGEKS